MNVNPQDEFKKIDIHMGGQVFNVIGQGRTEDHANLKNKLTGNIKYNVPISKILAALSKVKNITRSQGRGSEKLNRRRGR